MPATTLNPTQMHLLKMFSFAKSEKDLDVLKDALCAYFASNVEKGMDELWEKGQWNEDKNNAILKEHLRTPYGQR